MRESQSTNATVAVYTDADGVAFGVLASLARTAGVLLISGATLSVEGVKLSAQNVKSLADRGPDGSLQVAKVVWVHEPGGRRGGVGLSGRSVGPVGGTHK
jgi:hypothetical protein